MLNISQQQRYQRWDSLPDELREAMTSDVNSDFLWKTCEAEHIPDEKIYTVAKLSGYVLMGFIHPEDLAEEIHNELGIDKRIALSIQNAIVPRIFEPVHQFIDKVYSPITTTAAIHQDSSTSSPGTSNPPPKMITESFEAIPLASSAAITPISRPVTASPTLPVVKPPQVTPPPKPLPPPVPPKPSISNTGWSQQKPGPSAMAAMGALSQSTAKPTPAIAPAATPAPILTPAPAPIPKPAAVPEPAPIMLHEVTGSTLATQKTPDIKLDVGRRDQMTVTPPLAQAPSRPAILEIGASAAMKTSGITPPKPAPQSPQAPRVANYSQNVVPGGQRTITEITKAPAAASAPKPPTSIPTPPPVAQLTPMPVSKPPQPPVPPPNYR